MAAWMVRGESEQREAERSGASGWSSARTSRVQSGGRELRAERRGSRRRADEESGVEVGVAKGCKRTKRAV